MFLNGEKCQRALQNAEEYTGKIMNNVDYQKNQELITTTFEYKEPWAFVKEREDKLWTHWNL